MSTLDTIPFVVEMSTGETVPYNIDTTGNIGSGESLQGSPAPTAAVKSVVTGQTVAGAVSGSPTISGNIIQVVVLGSFLQKQQSYYLVTTFNTTATKKLQVRTQINVVF